MKLEKLFSWLTGAAFGFCIAYGGAAGMISGFRMENVDPSELLQFVLLFAAFAAGCFTLRWGGWVLAGTLALSAGFVLRSGELVDAVEGMLYRISEFYNSAYGWGLIRWSNGAPGLAELTPALCLMAALVILPVTWAVCRRQSAIFAVVPGILPLAACLVVTDAVPDSGSLCLLMAGLLLLVLTQMGRRRSASDGLRQTALLLIPAVLCTQLLFWAVPREQYQAAEHGVVLWKDWLSALTGDRSEDKDTPRVYALKSLGPRNYRGVKVMEVTVDSDSVLYLRGQAYYSYDGLNWIVSEPEKTGDPGWPELASQSMGTVRLKVRSAEGLKYFPYYPMNTDWDRDMAGGRLKNPDKLREYTFAITNPNLLAYGADAAIPEVYLQLPEETAAKARALQLLPKGELTVEQKASIIGRYVMESADYSLQTQAMHQEETDFAFWFLEESETGYCVHFATAAAVLLRAAGIPARYVTGYLVTAKAGQSTNVVDSHAHAWVEYYAEGKGWTVLDPTPAAEQQPEIRPTQPVQTQPDQPAETQDTETEQSQTQASAAVGETEKPGGNAMVLAYFAAVIGIFAGAGLIYVQYRLRRGIRRKRMHRGAPNDQALARWKEVRRYGKILKTAPPEMLLELAEKARFSQHTLTGGELMEFALYLNEASAELRKKNWVYRWLCRLIFAVE